MIIHRLRKIIAMAMILVMMTTSTIPFYCMAAEEYETETETAPLKEKEQKTVIPEELSEKAPEKIPEDRTEEQSEEKFNEKPNEIPIEIPAVSPVELPMETPTETPAELPTEAPTETPTETPMETPMETSMETTVEVPTEIPTDTSKEVSEKVSKARANEIPADALRNLPEIVYTLVLHSNYPSEGEKTEPDQEVSQELHYEELYMLPEEIFTNEYYILTGWNTRKDGTGTAFEKDAVVTKLTAEDSDVFILYAQWEQKENYVKLIFDTDGGTEIPDVMIRRNTDDNTIYIPWKNFATTREGYTWQSWKFKTYTISGTKEGDRYPNCNEAEYTVQAVWAKNPVVTFFDGIETTYKSLRYNTALGELPERPAFAYDYKSMIGWFNKETGGIQYTGTEKITKDITLYAHWGYIPRFNTNGGTLKSSLHYLPQESPLYPFGSLPETERTGYEFDGWYTADGQNRLSDGDIWDLSRGYEFTAHWVKKDVVTIVVDPNGGYILDPFMWETKNPVTYQYAAGSVFHGLPNIRRSKENRTFLGWLGDDGEYYTRDSILTHDVTITAQWSEVNYTVTFDPESSYGKGTAYVKTKIVAEGDSIGTLPGALLPGYLFVGWYTEPDGAGDLLTEDTIIMGDQTYYACYQEPVNQKTTEHFLYSYEAEWINASNEHVDNVAGNLNFHPKGNANQVATLHLRFTLDQQINYEETVPAEAIRIEVPKNIWKDWNNKWTGTCDLSSQLPPYPEIRNNMFFSYIDSGENYILVNNQELSGGTGLDVQISYQVTPWNVPGGAIDDNGNYVEGYDYYKGDVPVKFLVDTELDGVTETDDTVMLSVEMHTDDNVSGEKEFSQLYYQWDDNWGKKPADADDYFYIEWRLSTHFDPSWNQPYTWYWSEEPEHDGEIACYTYNNGKLWGEQGKVLSEPTTGSPQTRAVYTANKVIMKYPVSLLKDIPEEGLKIVNHAILTVKQKSGYMNQQVVRATYIINDAFYPWGEFTKNNGTSRYRQVSGGQDTLVEKEQPINLEWSLTYNGNSRNTLVTWDEQKQKYQAMKRTIQFTDGLQGDIMYSSGSNSAKFIWEPVTGNIALRDEDYQINYVSIDISERDVSKKGGVWTGAYSHAQDSDYDGTDVYIRYRNRSDFVYFKTVYGSFNKVVLPDHVVGYKVQHHSSFYETRMQVYMGVTLFPTDHVKGLIRQDLRKSVTSIIKNTAVCDIWNTDDPDREVFFHVDDFKGGTFPAEKESYELLASYHTQYTRKYASSQTNVLWDSVKGTQDNPISIEAGNYRANDPIYLTEGTFYDLLPAGTSVDASTLYGMKDTGNAIPFRNYADNYEMNKSSQDLINPSYYSVNFSENWQGSGRTMMIIKLRIPKEMKATGVIFAYLLHNSYENVMLNGNCVENDVAFVNTGLQKKPSSLDGKLDVVTEYQYYESLQQEHDGFISYAKATTNYIPISAFSWGFNKTVKGKGDFQKEAVTEPGDEYTYKLSYTQSDTALSEGFVFFDILDESDESESIWHGTFKEVDSSSISRVLTKDSTTVHCKPEIYYATKDRRQFTGSDFDTSNSQTWTKDKPSDLRQITAIAIDCRKNEDGTKFVMEGFQHLEVRVTMTAPSDTSLCNQTAYNKGYCYVNGERNTSSASILLKAVNLEIHKTSSPESGSPEKPTSVKRYDALEYVITIKNGEDQESIQEVVIDDEINDQLLFSEEDIRIQLNQGPKISITNSVRASVKKNGRQLQFTIHRIAPQEEYRIYIPTTVTKVKEGEMIENTAVITKANQKEVELFSETTYHKVPTVVPELLTLPNTGGAGRHLPWKEMMILSLLFLAAGSYLLTQKTKKHSHSC